MYHLPTVSVDWYQYKLFNNYFYCLESKYYNKLKLEHYGNLDIFIHILPVQ